MSSQPLGYFITFTTYGSWLHGDGRGSISRKKASVFVPENSALTAYEKSLQQHEAVALDDLARETVMQAILETCRIRDWGLYAAHIRSTHVHVVLKADTRPERVLVDLKAYATRMLRKNGYKQKRFWTRHGSTRYLNSTDQVNKAVYYVVCEQGKQMATYVKQDLTPELPNRPEE